MATDWILGIGLLFALALVFALLVKREFQISFIAFLFFFCGFLVWSSLLPSWILIMMLMVLIIFVYLKLKMGVV